MQIQQITSQVKKCIGQTRQIRVTLNDPLRVTRRNCASWVMADRLLPTNVKICKDLVKVISAQTC
jgi:hypothetical protein